jgi:hypothetical protein
MKKTILFAILALSINAFAQHTRSTFILAKVPSNSKEDIRSRVQDEELKTSGIYYKIDSEDLIKRQTLRPRSLIQINDSTYQWKWDTASTGWKAVSKDINIVYDTSNNMISVLKQHWVGSNWKDSLQYFYSYDANNNNLSAIIQNWNDSLSTWVNSYKQDYTYDISNNLICKLYQNWNCGLWENSYLRTYTYDASNNKLSEVDQSWDDTIWDNQYKWTYTYNANNSRTSTLYQHSGGTIWVNGTYEILSYDTHNNLISQLIQTWNNSAWVNLSKDTYSFDSNNKIISWLNQDWNGSVWENYLMFGFDYDANNNLISSLEQKWNGSVWENYWQHLYTYDANNNQTSCLYQSWETVVWVNNRQFLNTYERNNFMLSDAYKSWDYTGTEVDSGDSTFYYFNSGSVWPGDANNDTIVDNNDLLSVGLNYWTTGFARDSISNLWIGQSCPEWTGFQANLTNMKHADCNGDGIVNALDTVAINLNYGLTVSKKKQIFDNEKSAASLYVVPANPIYYAGDIASFDVIAGDISNPVNALYGMAYDIHVDPTYIEPGTLNFTHVASWLGNPAADALSLSKIFEIAGDIENAVIRIDHNDQSGYGKIGEFEFVIDPDIASIDTMHLSISYYNAVDAAGQPGSFNVIDTSIVIIPLTTSLSQYSVSDIVLYPNPVNGAFCITLLQSSEIEILNIEGQIIKSLNANENHTTIDISDFAKGMYFVKVKNENGVGVKKFIKE